MAAGDDFEPVAGAGRPRGGGRWRVVAILLAVGLALAVFGWKRYGRRPRGPLPELAHLASAVGGERSVAARLAGGFPWARLSAAARGRGAAPSLELLAAAAEAQRRCDAAATVENRSALAVADLLAGRIDPAIERMETLAREQPGSAERANDLAAALFERYRRAGSRADAEKALAILDGALKSSPRMPESLFNRALALEALSRWTPALEAWRAFIAADPQGGWAQEARTRLADLQSDPAKFSTPGATSKAAPPPAVPRPVPTTRASRR